MYFLCSKGLKKIMILISSAVQVRTSATNANTSNPYRKMLDFQEEIVSDASCCRRKENLNYT
jgi:hypothetical protein